MSRQRKDHNGNIYYGTSGIVATRKADYRPTVGVEFDKFVEKKLGKQYVKKFEVTPTFIISKFLTTFNEMLIERRCGGVMEDVGYFFVYYTPFHEPYKGSPKLNGRKVYNKKYRICFIPIHKGSPFRYYVLDFNTIRKTNLKLENNIKKGYRYLNLMNYVVPREMIYDCFDKYRVDLAIKSVEV